MPTLISPADLRAHVETDLTDMALQRLIDAEEAEIIRRHGAHEERVEVHRAAGGLSRIVLAFPARTVTTVTDSGAVLAAADYTVAADGQVLTRASGAWRGDVTVTYTPVSMAAQRIVALIALVKLQLAFSGYSNQNNPDGGEAPLALVAERERILATLQPRRRLFA